MKLRDSKGHQPCTCQVWPDLSTIVPGRCRQGNCAEFRCPACRGWLAGWGPIGCKCDGYIRYMWHPAMAPQLEHAAVKPSLPPGRHSNWRKRRR